MRTSTCGRRNSLSARKKWTLRPGWRYVLVAVLIGLLYVSGCQRPLQEPPSLEFTRYRVNVDDKRAVARVVGEIVNRGITPVGEVEVHATLIGTTGSERGQNMVPVRNLQPGEARAFALQVTTHGSVSNVQLTWKLPGAEASPMGEAEDRP